MKNLTTYALSTLFVSNLVACIGGDNLEPSLADQPRVAFPSSCAEAAQGFEAPADGERTLFVDGEAQRPWRAYCADMTSAPIEYLTLPTNSTWSMYRAGGRAIGSDVTTRFDKVRIDPVTLKLDITDTTFAVSEGSLTHIDGSKITEMPLGVAMSCGGGYATANVDVQGTPFLLTTDFATGGDAGHVGNADLWQNHDVMEMWADGDCGFVGPTSLTNAMKAPQGSIVLTYH